MIVSEALSQMLLGYLGIALMLVVGSVAFFGAEPGSLIRKELMKWGYSIK